MEGFQQGASTLLPGDHFLIRWRCLDLRLNGVEFGDPGQRLLGYRTGTALFHVIEVAADMRPASGFCDLFLAVEGIIAPIVIGLEDALPVAQKVLRVNALTVRGVIKDHDGMRGIRLTAIHLEIGFVRLAAAGVEDRQGRLVGVQNLSFQQGHFAGFGEQSDPVFALTQPTAEGGA